MEGWSVDHVIVAVVAVNPLEATLPITGIAAAVEKLKLADVVVLAEFVDMAA